MFKRFPFPESLEYTLTELMFHKLQNPLTQYKLFKTRATELQLLLLLSASKRQQEPITRNGAPDNG